MIKLVETSFAAHYINEEQSLLEQCWINPDSKMNIEEYKVDMLHYLQIVKKYQIRFALIDTRQFGFTISPETQDWIDKTIAIEANQIVKKIAFLLPHDLIEQLSIEQTMDEEEGTKYNAIQYFEDKQKAINWLLSS